MLDWLIIGGGIHGTHLSLVLTTTAGAEAERVRVLDPHPAPLARWDACTAATGMLHLRSPSVHHLDLDPWSLQRFAHGPGKRHRSFAPPYDRPGLELFARHVEAVMERHHLGALRVLGRAERIVPEEHAVRVETSQGALHAKRVILALGASEQPSWPDWARALRDAEPTAPLQHIFEPGFDRRALPAFSRLVVIGGGISAAQVTLTLGLAHPGTVTLLARHALREHQFDSDPGWLGPKHLAGFSREPDLARRRALIAAARHRGSMPKEVHRHLRLAAQRRELKLDHGEVRALERTPSGLLLHLEDGRSLAADRVLLATGFDRRRPGGRLLDALIEEHAFPCAACGYPQVDTALRWHPRVFVTGPLAELELGPTARNIAGARAAGDRIARAA